MLMWVFKNLYFSPHQYLHHFVKALRSSLCLRFFLAKLSTAPYASPNTHRSLKQMLLEITNYKLWKCFAALFHPCSALWSWTWQFWMCVCSKASGSGKALNFLRIFALWRSGWYLTCSWACLQVKVTDVWNQNSWAWPLRLSSNMDVPSTQLFFCVWQRVLGRIWWWGEAKEKAQDDDNGSDRLRQHWNPTAVQRRQQPLGCRRLGQWEQLCSALWALPHQGPGW